MGNKESRDNDRGRTDYSSNNRPEKTFFQELIDKETNSTEKQAGWSVLREPVDKPEKTFLRELIDRESDRTENSPRERVSVREHARETGEDRGNNRESKHELTNAISPTSETAQPDEEKKRKASTTLEIENIKTRKITTVANEQIKETRADSRNDRELGEIPSSSQEASKSSNSQPGWSVLREPADKPEKTFLQELLDRESNRTENQPGWSVLRESVGKPEKTFLQELLDRETSRTEHSPSGDGPVREIVKEPVGTEKINQSSSNDANLAKETIDQGVESKKQRQRIDKQNYSADLSGSLDKLNRSKKLTSDQEEILRENGYGYFIDNFIEPAVEGSSIKSTPVYYGGEKPQWEQQEESVSNKNERRVEDMITGLTLMAKDEIKYRETRGDINYNESACHKGLLQHQKISKHTARVLDEEKKPENELLSTIVSNVIKAPPELKESVRILNKFRSNQAAKELAAVNNDNKNLYYSKAKTDINKMITRNRKHKKIDEEYRNGQWKTFSEARTNKMYHLGMKVSIDATKLELAEVRGRAVRLAQQVENTIRRGGDVDLLAPPVAGSKSKFINTKGLNATHDILSNQDLRDATKIASRIVYGRTGQAINQCLEYPIDKINQKVLQAKEKHDEHNAAVALERSSDFQKRHYAGESIDDRIDCLSQAMSSVNEELAVGSIEPTTSSDSDSSISSLSSTGKKQKASHVAP